MNAGQYREYDALDRVREHCKTHPLPSPPPAFPQRLAALEVALDKLRDHAVQQRVETGRKTGGTRIQSTLRRELREHHMIPLRRIARASASEIPELRVGFDVPQQRCSQPDLVARAKAMAKRARTYKAVFLASGRPADFVEQLLAAAKGLERAALDTQAASGRRSGSTAGVLQVLQEGRVAMRHLDAMYRTAYSDDTPMLALWRAARRVHRGRRAGGEQEPEIRGESGEIGQGRETMGGAVSSLASEH